MKQNDEKQNDELIIKGEKKKERKGKERKENGIRANRHE
jgi:hypothetical protein